MYTVKKHKKNDVFQVGVEKEEDFPPTEDQPGLVKRLRDVIIRVMSPRG
jgi:hypothetical protein